MKEEKNSIKNTKVYKMGNETRHTVPTMLGYEKLVAWAKDGKFIWICKGFSA